MFQKNVASQKIFVFAWDTTADAPKTGDAANITAKISKDAGTPASTNDANPTELNATDTPGIYVFDMTQAETNCNSLVLRAVSSTSGVLIEPVIIYPFDYTTLDTNIDSILADTGTDGVVLSTGTIEALADAMLQRDLSNSDGSAAVHSLYTVLMMRLESAISGSTWTIYETDGTTTHTTRTITTSASADPVTAVS